MLPQLLTLKFETTMGAFYLGDYGTCYSRPASIVFERDERRAMPLVFRGKAYGIGMDTD